MRHPYPPRSKTLVQFVTEDRNSIVQQDAAYDATPYEVLATYREMLADGFALVRTLTVKSDGSTEASGWGSIAVCIEAHDLCEARQFDAALALMSANPGQDRLADAVAQLQRGRNQA